MSGVFRIYFEVYRLENSNFTGAEQFGIPPDL